VARCPPPPSSSASDQPGASPEQPGAGSEPVGPTWNAWAARKRLPPPRRRGPARSRARPARRPAQSSLARAAVVDAEHISGRVAERPGLHVISHGHRAVDPGTTEGFGLRQRLLHVGDARVDRGPARLLAGTEATLDALPCPGVGHAITGVAAADRPAEQLPVEPLRPSGVGAQHLEPVDRLTSAGRRPGRLLAG